MWCIHTVVPTQPLLGRNPVLFYWIDQTFICSTAVQTFARRILTSLSVDETLLLRYMNLFTNFRELPFRVEMVPSRVKTHVPHFVCVLVEANASCCLVMQLGFGLIRCICMKRFVICIVSVHYIFCGVSSASGLFCVKLFSFIRSIDVRST